MENLGKTKAKQESFNQGKAVETERHNIGGRQEAQEDFIHGGSGGSEPEIDNFNPAGKTIVIYKTFTP